MKTILSVLFLAIVATSVVATTTSSSGLTTSLEAQFASFARTYGKNYQGPEFHARMRIFAQNMKNIEEHNRDPAYKYQLGVNQFSDMTYEEFARIMLHPEPYDEEKGLVEVTTTTTTTTTPKTDQQDFVVDLRTRNIVPPVGDQGSCGSCWAFSAASASSIAVNTRLRPAVPIDLSDMQTLECSGGGSCAGGLRFEAAEYIKRVGLVVASVYPYILRSPLRCNQSLVDGNQKYQLEDYAAWDSPDTRIEVESKMRNAIDKLQGVMVGMDAQSKFMQYKTGIFTGEPSCSSLTTNHALVAVGYGSEGGVEYWIIRNSWGEAWGEQGHIRVLRGKNVCAVEQRSGSTW